MTAVVWASGAEVKTAAGSALTDDNAALAATMASEALASATGNQFGTTRETVRPEGCGRSCDWGPPSSRAVVGWGMGLALASFLGPWPLPGPAGGMAAECGGCGCWSTSGVELQGPVVWDADGNEIVVKVDGTVLDYGTGWVRIDRPGKMPLIVRTDGHIFPHCQDIRIADTEVGTCSITYTRGRPVPELGHQAAIALAVQLARWFKWIAGDSCLPDTLRSISRQGVTAVGMDITDLIKEGGTGITAVDYFVQSVNPNGLRRAARIFTPGYTDPLPTVRSLPV